MRESPGVAEDAHGAFGDGGTGETERLKRERRARARGKVRDECVVCDVRGGGGDAGEFQVLERWAEVGQDVAHGFVARERRARATQLDEIRRELVPYDGRPITEIRAARDV